jgi:hypothetical protein
MPKKKLEPKGADAPSPSDERFETESRNGVRVLAKEFVFRGEHFGIGTLAKDVERHIRRIKDKEEKASR